MPEDIGYDCIDQLVADMKKEENFKMGGGLAAGLGLSLMIPGAGWLLGGALALGGLALGAFSLKSLNDRKDDAMRQIDIVIKNFERELAALLNSSYLQSKTQYLEVLKDSLISQKKAYAKNIKKYNQKIGQDGMCLKQAASFLNTHIEQLQKIGKDLAEWQEKSVFVQEEENGNES